MSLATILGHEHARTHTHTHTHVAPAHASKLTIQSLIYTTQNGQQAETWDGWRQQHGMENTANQQSVTGACHHSLRVSAAKHCCWKVYICSYKYTAPLCSNNFTVRSCRNRKQFCSSKTTTLQWHTYICSYKYAALHSNNFTVSSCQNRKQFCSSKNQLCSDKHTLVFAIAKLVANFFFCVQNWVHRNIAGSLMESFECCFGFGRGCSVQNYLIIITYMTVVEIGVGVGGGWWGGGGGALCMQLLKPYCIASRDVDAVRQDGSWFQFLSDAWEVWVVDVKVTCGNKAENLHFCTWKTSCCKHGRQSMKDNILYSCQVTFIHSWT